MKILLNKLSYFVRQIGYALAEPISRNLIYIKKYDIIKEKGSGFIVFATPYSNRNYYWSNLGLDKRYAYQSNSSPIFKKRIYFTTNISWGNCNGVCSNTYFCNYLI